jgi:peptide deformylase
MNNTPAVRLFGDPVLRLPTKPVVEVTTNTQELVQTLYDTLHQYNGIGMAAPQIGYSDAICVIHLGPLCSYVLINPVIILASDQYCIAGGGCLSLPNEYRNISRPDGIVVNHLGLDGSACTSAFTGIVARIAQHEIDHLNGKLIIDYPNVASD